ncbi:hypothetical protein JTB14_007476 [Gonioctena quinquepunctata]|nr:hypothetical protein JTB14_007476 [Gonioctena quinquepunctata]
MCVRRQGTHFRPNQPYPFEGYTIVKNDMDPIIEAKWKVAYIIRGDVQFKPIQLNTNFQTDIEQTVNHLPEPFPLVSVFNSHNPLWGSDHLDVRGRIEQFSEGDDLLVLNSSSPTYFNAEARHFSGIDLSISSARLAPKLGWTIANDSYHSNHYPIIIPTDIPRNRQPLSHRWMKANWPNFDENLIPLTLNNNISQNVEILSTAITGVAQRTIPLSDILPKKTCGTLVEPAS